MKLAEKLQLMRKREGLSQEDLAEKLGISRQAVSKWESGQSVPDLNKLIILSELYNVTIDYLVKETYEFEGSQEKEISNTGKQYGENLENKETQLIIHFNNKYSLEYEYKSKKTICGVPVVHINLGRGLKKAKGIIAIGNISCGVISIGFISIGIFSLGFLSIGLISIALLAIGFLLSIGTISLGGFSIGAIAVGKYSIGASAIASDIAIGNITEGSNLISLGTSGEEIEELIKHEYPNLAQWVVNKIKFFVGCIR
ncbi:helix-turn-helix domain-containing protein [Clostridium perfringens]